ncbi:MAG TPA: TadE/TadG family type IV pilus assembly protein [Acidimicrobiales bacterium]|nr:TadE/TadG family type IV pilus assembly protein [Acidimicrobiales bacterium]
MRRGSEEGQATVELALVLPLVVLLLLAVVQVALIARDAVLVVHAAREAVREAAVTAASGAAQRAAEAGSGLTGPRLVVTVNRREPPGGQVQVTVNYRAPTDVPLVGPIIPDVRLSSGAVMRVES